MRDVLHFHIDLYPYSIMDLTYIFLSNLHFHPHEICLINVFDSFIPVITLKTLRFKSSILFGRQTLLGKSFRVLQLPTHVSNLMANGY